MSLQDLIKMTASLSRITDANTAEKEFFNECVCANSGQDNEADEATLAYYIKKDADFVSKFVELVEQETKKASRVLMTFNSLNEMNAFIKAGNECGSAWYENDLIHCYCYKFAESVEVVEAEKTLRESMNMKAGIVKNAHVMNVEKGFNAYETLCLICAELSVDLSKVSDSDFDSCSIILSDFCSSLNVETGFTVSVWFDNK